MAHQAGQFGLSLAEQEAARSETQRLNSRELGDITKRADLDRAMDQQRITQQGQQFGLSIAEQEAARIEDQRLQSRGLTDRSRQAEQARALEREQMAQQAGQFGLSLTEQEAARTEAQRLRSRELTDRTRQAELDRTQQAGQFGLSLTEQETARLQQAGQFKTSTEMAQDVSKAERDAQILAQLLGTADKHEDQRKMLGYDDKAFAKAETERLMQSLGLRPIS